MAESPTPSIRPIAGLARITLRYAFAAAITVVAVVLQHELQAVTSHVPFILYFLTTFLASWVGGSGPGFLAVALGAALANYHFLPPEDEFSTSRDALVATGLFALVSALVNLLTAKVHADLREQKALVRSLEESKAREQAAREQAEGEAQLRERLMAILGHDLRQPVSVVSVSAKLLSRSELRPEDIPLVVERIERNTRRIDRMIQELLDFSRARSAGGMPIRPKPTSLTRVCQRAVEEAHLSNAGRAISLEAAEEIQGTWDPHRLLQLLSNLVGNALQHGDPGAPVSVRVRREGELAALSVHNRGDPIPPDLLPDVFEPFRRGEWKGGDSGGLGLGLYIVSQIARSHAGRVAVQSSPEEGTTFTVWLPLSPSINPTIGPGPEQSRKRERVGD